MEQPISSLAGQFLEAVEASDFETVGRLLHDEFVMEWPQSGERFRGRDNAIAAMRAQTTKPQRAAEPRIVGTADTQVVMVPLRYGEEIWQYVGVFELDGGKIRRATEFFGAPFPAQEFRSQYTDKT